MAAEVNTPPAENPGVQVSEQAISEGLIQTEVPGFFTTAWDRDVVKYGWASTPINVITRKLGFRTTKTMTFGYWSLGMRECMLKTTTSITLPTIAAAEVARNETEEVTIKVDAAKRIDLTDQIMFKGYSGTNSKGEKVPYMPLNARVTKVDRSKGEVSVIFMNGVSGETIAAGTTILVLGHALAEGDARVTPHSANPVGTTQQMQKFMCTASATNIYLEAAKEANYGLADLVEANNQQFVEEIEKTYIWGIRSITTDPQTNERTYTCAGLIQQMLEGGSHVIEIQEDLVSDKTLQDAMTDIFIGNSGSGSRYMLDGIEVFKALLNRSDVTKHQDANDTVTKFEYDWSRIRLQNFNLYQMPHPLLDKLGFSNYALVLDMKYVERRVFRTMKQDTRDLMALGEHDSKEVRCQEISSILLKSPKSHALIIITKAPAGDAAQPGAGA